MRDPMETALLLIDTGNCERLTTVGYGCIADTGLRADAQYSADRWCNSCIAHFGLRFSANRARRAPQESV